MRLDALVFILDLDLLSYFVLAYSEGNGATVQIGRPV